MGDDTQVVRELWARWNAGDRAADATVIDPEIEIHSQLTGAIWRGVDGLQQWAAEIDEQFGAWRVEIAETRVLDDRRVLVTGSIHGRGRQSGIDLDEPAAWLVELRDGRMLRMHNYVGRQAAESAIASVS
jgi:ketosteroid isomerase-like protein